MKIVYLFLGLFVMIGVTSGFEAWHKNKVQDCAMTLSTAGKPLAEIREICK